jgi:hypothetical protein
MTDPRTIIKDIRGIPHPPLKVVDALNTFLAGYMEQNRMNDLYLSQARIAEERRMEEEAIAQTQWLEKQRVANMERIRPAQEALQAKKARQEQISKVRMKNLKKAWKARNG